MAFDEQSAVIVALVEGDTWLFDVTTNTWEQRTPLGYRLTGRVRAVYDPEADLTVVLGWDNGLAVWVYDVDTDRWEPRSHPDVLDDRGLAGYDASLGRVVLLNNDQAWTYDVATDIWERLDTESLGDAIGTFLMAYDPVVRGMVVVSGAQSYRDTWIFQADSIFPPGPRWTREDTVTPILNFVYGDLTLGTEMTYDGATGRVAMFADGVLAEYDAQTKEWEILKDTNYSGTGVGPLHRLEHTIVYDPVNRRLVLYGGSSRMPDGWENRDDVWAFDPLTREWTVLLEATRAVGVYGVRLEGGDFFERASTQPDWRRGLGLVSAPETVADGQFLVQGQQWDEGPVWWESGAVNEGWGDQQPRWIELDLGGHVTIGSAIVQADMNDEYLLSYRDPTTGEWEPLWHVPVGWSGGMDTRPNPLDHTEPMIFPEPVTTDRLRFEAWSGDGMYSVSEIQVFTTLSSELGAEVWVGPASEGTVTATPVDWGITLNDQGQGIHLVFMIVDARPLTEDRVEDLSGRLIWDETVVDLCYIHIRDVGDGFLRIGDVFGTSEGCGDNPTVMQEAFDEFGLPETACVTVRFDGDDHDYCAPLR